MVSEPGSTSPLPQPQCIPSHPTDQTNPKPSGSSGMGGSAGGCGEGAVSPLDAHTVEDDGRAGAQGSSVIQSYGVPKNRRLDPPVNVSAWSGLGGLALYMNITI